MASGQQVGYVRVSSVDQNTARQLDGVALDKIFEDKASGKDTKRPSLTACLEYVRDGDTLHVHSLDRLARSLDDLRKLVKDLTGRGVVVHFHKENLIFSGSDSPMSVLLLNLLGSVAEFERALLLERQREGIAIAKTKGVYKGREPSLTAEQVVELKTRKAAGESVASIARAMNVSRPTLYRYLKGPAEEKPVLLLMPNVDPTTGRLSGAGKKRTLVPNE